MLQASQKMKTAAMLHRYSDLPDNGVTTIADYTVHYINGLSLAVQYHDEFIKRIYHFDSTAPEPRVIDGGSNIGMSILYFKSVYPNAHVIGFEPDQSIYRILQQNIDGNHLKDVELVKAGLGSSHGTIRFAPDGDQGGAINTESGTMEIDIVPLVDYLKEPVDFLKLNIEGAEYEVLAAAEQQLHQVRQMVIEYHHLPELPHTLHLILSLLDRQGFDYLINGFTPETNSVVYPPFKLMPDSRYFLLIYACQRNP